MKDVIKVKVATSNGHNGGFEDVRGEPGDLSEVMEDGSKVLDVFLDRSHEDGRIVRIK
jgi:hypothetical protein